MAHVRAVPDTLAPLESELKKERASSLGRAGAALGQAMVAWRDAEERGAPDALELRKQAQTRLWYLVVQREALGLRRHRELYELYGVPKPWWY
jgi:hypothetical protein